ncbi:hypothetical protein [Solitalea lacus]|uniref:hypothetical protein n=1 Tax=Solitalea lacus TaxID=2911172 RepID=UPI001EDB15E8|nr:hypothetical protein [Solitalea lacus]UKJ06185.1 hypothetical protein L2B55_11615 [Solitalea lacus]
MKKIYLSLLFVCFTFFAFCQVDKNVGKYFEFNENVSLEKCDGIGNTIAGSEIINAGVQFKIDGTATGGYVIHILQKGSDVAFNTRLYLSSFSAATLKNSLPDRFFLLPLQTFNTKCKPRLTKNSFTIGTVLLPIKMRFGSSSKVENIYNKDFLLTNDVSLGFSIGYKRKWSQEWGLDILGGFSVTSIQVDSSTTKGYYKSASNASGVTGHFGILLENNNFQFGLFTGIDYLTGGVGKQWIYKDQPWVGIAIGYSLFKTKSSQDIQ